MTTSNCQCANFGILISRARDRDAILLRIAQSIHTTSLHRSLNMFDIIYLSRKSVYRNCVQLNAQIRGAFIERYISRRCDDLFSKTVEGCCYISGSVIPLTLLGQSRYVFIDMMILGTTAPVVITPAAGVLHIETTSTSILRKRRDGEDLMQNNEHRL